MGVDGQQATATVVAKDADDDLAVLKSAYKPRAFARFRRSGRVALGETIMVAGYPLSGLLTSGLNVTDGAVSALAGVGDNPRMLQITAPVQPGNSGGPLLDKSGNVMGVVVAKLNALSVAKATGDIPQNVNFAIKAPVAKSFLDIHGIDYETSSNDDAIGPEAVARKAGRYTVPVVCWK